MLTTASSVSSGGSAAQPTTRAYCAPEMFKGESKSTATDVYAFGVLMWEFLTCEVPFAENPSLIADLVKAGHRPPIPASLVSLPKPLLHCTTGTSPEGVCVCVCVCVWS